MPCSSASPCPRAGTRRIRSGLSKWRPDTRKGEVAGSRQGHADKTASFINEYIFPGGYLPSVTQLLNHIAIESKGTLIVEHVENIGGHYARTLRLWKEQFLAKFDQKIRPALLEEHPGMGDDEVDVFRRKWEVSFEETHVAAMAS